jgi:hypothetical protein
MVWLAGGEVAALEVYGDCSGDLLAMGKCGRRAA